MAKFSLFSSEKKQDLDKGLQKTKESFVKKLSRVVIGKSTIDDTTLDDLEEVLVTSDVGVETTLKIIDRIEKRVAKDKYLNAEELNGLLKEEITTLLSENDNYAIAKDFDGDLPHKPYVIMVVGVNGVGCA